ncbi:MAG: LysM peptidoglycan-binding domain-containing protein [Desulfotomaculaceae bacterium]|nr:LysM peptidoglycan-binding domain-containing protein [Desulfotomaculaceae bacterium]MDD4767386.1 LysM peptidoglycan-binding domain-containing protein [Desulfotomaculaceae bacterium]
MPLYFRVLCFFVLGVFFMPITALATATHTVLPGESLYVISRDYGITVASLMEANGVKDHLIYPGQKLSIPGSQASQGYTADTGRTTCTVQAGESLWLIAQKYGVSYQDLVAANNLKSTVIYPGMVLNLPAGTVTGAAPQVSRGTPQVSRGGLFERPSPADVDLLARLITAEADGEPYEGKVGVGAVVLNRVETPGFPKTIPGVIYEQGNGIYQFEPVQNGWINRPSSSASLQAAKDALAGADPTNGATYFFANYAKSNWLWARPVSKTIGNTIFSY